MGGAGNSTAGDEPGQLLVAARREPVAFGRFYSKTRDGLLAYFYAQTFCPEVAADLAAETFAEALRVLSRYDPARGTGSHWLYGIAKNQLRVWMRKGRVEDRARRRLGLSTDGFGEEDFTHVESLVRSATCAKHSSGSA